MAAVLAGGAGAVLSHRPAAALWELRGWDGAVDVTCPGRRSSRPGLRVHEIALPADEVTVRGGIPVTTVARTLFDLAAVLPRHRLEQAFGEAERRGLGDTPSLPELVARYPGRRGVATLRAVLAAGRIGLDIPRSELEARFLAFLRDRHLPHPEVNASITARGRWLEVDCLWRPAALIAELDGHAFHADDDAYEGDRIRDRMLTADGWNVVRVTWRQLHLETDQLEADLRASLARRAAGLVR